MTCSRHLCTHITARLLTLLLWLVIAFVATTRPAQAQAATQATPVAQTVLVQFQPATTVAERDALIAQMGGELVTWIAAIHVAEVRLVAQGGMAVAAAAPITASDKVAFAEADYMVTGAYVPADPAFVNASQSYAFDRIAAPQAWEITRGSEQIIIAVVDSGIQLDHPEFTGRIVAGYDFVDGDKQANDETGHGTHVAGIIAAGLDNNQGSAGLCPGCRLLPVRVLDENNMGRLSDLAQGIIFAADQGARIINLSIGTLVESQTVAEAVRYAQRLGVLVVAAAGNNSSEAPFYPAAQAGVIAVSATSSDDSRWTRSNYGMAIDLAAPGDLIFSAYHDMNNEFGGYTYMSGTSMAAPFVSGMAGLILSLQPALSSSDVTDALLWGVDDLGAAGWDADYGYGRLNAYGALTAPVEGLAQAVGDLAPSSNYLVFLPALEN